MDDERNKQLNMGKEECARFVWSVLEKNKYNSEEVGRVMGMLYAEILVSAYRACRHYGTGIFPSFKEQWFDWLNKYCKHVDQLVRENEVKDIIGLVTYNVPLGEYCKTGKPNEGNKIVRGENNE